MGRSTNLISHNLAARTLGISRDWMTHLVTTGAIIPAVDRGFPKNSLYLWEEIRAYKKLKRSDPPSNAAQLARQALALSQAVKRRFDALCHTLGVDGRVLSYEEEDVYRLHVRVQRALHPNRYRFSDKTKLAWASVFNAIDESYLHHVQQLSECRSPWLHYMQLANKLVALSAVEEEAGRSFTHGCLESARKHLRSVAYFYVRNELGSTPANALFLDTNAVEEVIAHLHPRALDI